MKQVFTSAIGTPGSFVLDYVCNMFMGDGWTQTGSEGRVTHPWAAAGNLRNLKIVLGANATGTQTFTVRKNGSDTAMAVTITAGNASGTYTGDLSVAAGDTLALKIVGAGTPQFVFASVEFEGSTTAQSAYATSVSGGLNSNSANRYNALFRGADQWAGTEDHSSRNIVAVSGVINALYVRLDAAPTAGNSWIFSIYKNGVKQDGSGGTVDTRVTIADAATSGNATFSLPVAGGDYVSLECDPVSTPTQTRVQYACRFTADEDGWSQFCGRTSSSLNTGSTVYNNPSFKGQSNPWTTTEADHDVPGGLTSFVLSGLVAGLSGTPGVGKSYTLDGRVNAATPTGAPVVTIADVATQGSGAGSMTVTPSDLLTIRSVPSGTPSARSATWVFGQYIAPPVCRVTHLIGLVVQDRAPDPAIADDPTGGGTVGTGTDPAAGLDLCTAEVPVAYVDLTPPGGSTYRLSAVPMNRTVSDRPIVQRFGRITRSLTSRQGDLRGASFSPILIDTDRFLRGLEDTDSLVNAIVEVYLTSKAGLDAGSTARRILSGLVTETEPLGGLLMQLHVSDYLQGLLERVPAPTYPQRVFTTTDFPNLANPPGDVASPGNPALIGKPVPIGYGILSDEADGAAAKGVVPSYFVGTRTVDGYPWDEYVLFGHAPSPGGVLGFFGEINGTRQKFDGTYEGIDFLWPGHPGWNAALGSSDLYRDFNSNRYTVFYARGPRSLYAREGKIPFAINIGGVEDVGDGTGNCITSIARQALHFLINFVSQNWTSGAWLASPTVNGYSRFETASFEAVRTRSAARMSTSEGYLGAYLLGWDGGSITLRDVIRLWHECGIDLGVNKDGQVMASMVSPAAAAVRSVSDVTDTTRESFRARRRRDEIRNTLTYRYARRYVPALPEPTPAEGDALPAQLRQSQVDWEVDNVSPTPDAASVAKYGTRALDLSLELVRDADTAADIAAMHQEVLAPGPIAVGYREGLCGTNVDLGDNVELDHFEGLTASGYTDRTLRCEVHILDLDAFETEIEGLDVENL